MRELWQELNRRNVISWLVKYSVLVFGVLQGADIIAHTLDSPRWVMLLFIAASAAGYPAVIASCWFFTLTPNGIQRRTSGSAAAIPVTAKRIFVRRAIWVALILLCLGTTTTWIYFHRRTPSPVAEVSPSNHEMTVLVAPFSGPDGAAVAEGKTFQAWIGSRLSHMLEIDPHAHVIYDPTLEAPRSATEAKNLGRRNHAQLTVWGDVVVSGSVTTISPHLEKTHLEQNFETPMIPERLAQLSKLSSSTVAEKQEKAAQVAQLAALKAAMIYLTEFHQIDRCRSLLQVIEPVDATVYSLRSLVESSSRENAKSESIAREAIKQFPDEPWVYLALGQTLIFQGRSNEAHEALQKAKNLAPKSFWTLVMTAFVEVMEGDTVHSVVDMQAAVDNDPGNPMAWRILSFLQRAAGHLDEAEQSMRKSVLLDPDRADSHAALALLLTNTKTEEAIAELRKAVVLDPEEPNYRTSLGIHLLKSNERNLRDEGMLTLRDAIERDPSSSFSHSALADALVDYDLNEAIVERRKAMETSMVPELERIELADELIQTGDPKNINQGLQLVRKKLAETEDPQMVAKLAMMLISRDLNDEAISKIRSQLIKNPHVAVLHRTLAVALYAKGESAEAYREIDLAISTESKNPQWPYLRIEMLIGDDSPQVDEEMTKLKVVAAGSPYYLAIHALRAAEQGHWPETITLANEKLEATPTDSLMQFLKAYALIAENKVSEAHDVAVKLGDEKNRDVYYHLLSFVAMAKLGNVDEARTQLKRYGMHWKNIGWPRAAYQLFVGDKISEQEVLESAKWQSDRSEAHYFLSVAHALGLLPSRGLDDQTTHWHEALKTRSVQSDFHFLARIELAKQNRVSAPENR